MRSRQSHCQRPRSGPGDRRISTRSNKGIRVTESLEAEGLRRGWRRRAGGDGPRASVANTGITLDDITDPRSWGEAMASDKKAEWLEAAWSEWESFLSNGTFEFTPRSNRHCPRGRDLQSRLQERRPPFRTAI